MIKLIMVDKKNYDINSWYIAWIQDLALNDVEETISWNKKNVKWLVTDWLPENLLIVKKNLISAVFAIGISRNPEYVKNIIECILTWHSDWLWEYLNDDIKQNWELAVWLQFIWHMDLKTIKENIIILENIVKNLNEKEKQQLSNNINNSFKTGRLKMRTTLNLWWNNLFQNNRTTRDQESYFRPGSWF